MATQRRRLFRFYKAQSLNLDGRFGACYEYLRLSDA